MKPSAEPREVTCDSYRGGGSQLSFIILPLLVCLAKHSTLAVFSHSWPGSKSFLVNRTHSPTHPHVNFSQYTACFLFLLLPLIERNSSDVLSVTSMSRKQLSERSNKSGVHAYSCRHSDEFRHLHDDELAEFISRELHERKTHIIRKTVQILGRQKTIQIFNETVKELKSGGVHTRVKNGSRQRSPGGVFFTIIKENPDPDIAKEYHTIKQGDVEEQERQWMKRKRQRDRKAQGQGNKNSDAGTHPGEPVPPREITTTCSNEPQLASIPPQLSPTTQLHKRPVTVQRKESTSSEHLDEPVVSSTKGRD